MRIIEALPDWREYRARIDGSVGFVPTMGALHEGHLALLRRSVAENTHTVLSIYLNPTQFNNPNDLANYPSTLEQDLQFAEEIGVTSVLTPAYHELYADDYRYQVVENGFSSELCGSHRPGHFTGVLTVVMKLLNLVRPDRAYFGEKDYQQYLLIRDMAAAFFLDTDIVGCATVRAVDGLALSSRNANLDEPGRALAPLLYSRISGGCSDADVASALTGDGFDVDYVVSREGRRFAAATLDCGDRTVRLIDNVPLAGDG